MSEAKIERLDWARPLWTRDGRSARLLGKLAGADVEQPYVVAIRQRYGDEELLETYLPNGSWGAVYGPSDYDLENGPDAEVTP